MKTVTTELEIAIGQNLTFLCRLWTITRKGGFVHRFTDHDRDITFEGELYKASSSFQASAIQTNLNTAASDMDIVLLLSEGSVEYLDMTRGFYDDAPVTLEVVSYKHLDAGSIKLFEGHVKTISVPNQQSALLALTGSVGRTSRDINERYSAKCRAQFGDDRCKVDLSAHTTAFAVDTVPASLAFTASELTAVAENLYVFGVVIWTTGNNTGSRVEVAGNDAGLVQLLFRPPYPIEVGDTGNIVRGCANTVDACIGYSNLPNYRGEPYVPGDEGLSY